MIYPERPTGNAWQLIGNTFNQGAGIVERFGEQQNALQALVERRTQAALEQKRLEREQAARDWEFEQKKAGEKRASDSAEFAKGQMASPTLAKDPSLAVSSKPMFSGGPSRSEVDALTLAEDQLPSQQVSSGDSTALMGQALDRMQMADPNPGRVPRTREEILQNQLENRQITGRDWATITEPLKTMEGQREILSLKNENQDKRDQARREHDWAKAEFNQGRIDRRQLAGYRAREELAQKAYDLAPKGAGGLKKEGLGDTEIKSIKDIRRTSGLLKRIDQAADNISNLKRGPISGRVSGVNPYDADIAQLEKLVKQTVPSLARGVFGEVGVLTDEDVKRYQDMFATIKTDPSVARTLMDDLKKTIEDSWYVTLDTYDKSNKNIAGFDPHWSFDDIAKVGPSESNNQPNQPPKPSADAKNKPYDRAVVAEFLSKAGGDRKKAKLMMKQAGYNINE